MENEFILQVWDEQGWASGNSIEKARWEIADEVIPIMEQHIQEGNIYHFEIYSML